MEKLMPCRMMQQVIINSLLSGWAHQKYFKKKLFDNFSKKGLVKRIPFASQNMAKFQQKKLFAQ